MKTDRTLFFVVFLFIGISIGTSFGQEFNETEIPLGAIIKYYGEEYQASPIFKGHAEQVFYWKGYKIRILNWGNCWRDKSCGAAYKGFFVIKNKNGENVCSDMLNTAEWYGENVCVIDAWNKKVLDDGKLIIKTYNINPHPRGKFYKFQIFININQENINKKESNNLKESNKLLVLGLGLIIILSIALILISRRR